MSVAPVSTVFGGATRAHAQPKPSRQPVLGALNDQPNDAVSGRLAGWLKRCLYAVMVPRLMVL